jgi:hypothetical protein
VGTALLLQLAGVSQLVSLPPPVQVMSDKAVRRK